MMIKRFEKLGLLFLVIFVVAVSTVGFYVKDIYADPGSICRNCNCGDTSSTESLIEDNHHPDGEEEVMTAWTQDFVDHRKYIVSEYFRKYFVPALMKLTEQMSNIGMMQMLEVGKFFDAKLYLETQRLFNELQNEAARDYFPSESFCSFGTNIRSLEHSESLARANHAALNKLSLDRRLGRILSSNSGKDVFDEKKARWEQFKTTFCDRTQNNWTGGATGLSYATMPSGGTADICGAGTSDKNRVNIDIDYPKLVGFKKTYDDLNFYDGSSGLSDDEENILAMGKNLFAHDTLTGLLPEIDQDKGQYNLLALRSIAARRSVAVNSYHALVSLRTPGSTDPSFSDNAQFLRAIIADLGITDINDINAVYGENPSYLAQLEILVSSLRNNDFYTDLVEDSSNVVRKKGALNGLESLIDNAIIESRERQNMLFSVILSSKLDQNRIRTYGQYQTGR